MLRLLIVLVLLAGPAWADGMQIGYANSDGSQDTYDTQKKTWELGFANSDGSQDTYNTGTGKWSLGYANSDGSEDRYEQQGYDSNDQEEQNPKDP